MSWKDNLLQASFRGVPFFFNSHDYEFGRKNIFHDYPFRDDAELEDQGRSTDGFSITGYVLANKDNNFDYFSDRNKLIDALKEPGAGQLVHRYLGNKNVALSSIAKMSEVFNEGGIARFQMTFKEVKQEVPFVITIDPVTAMDEVAEDSSNRLLDTYTAIMDTTADLQKVVNDIQGGMQSAISKIRELKELPGTVISTATGLVFSAVNLVNTVLDAPCDLANAVSGGLDSFLFAAGMLDDSVSRDILGACSGRVQNPDDADRNSDQLSQTEGIAIAQASVGLSTYGSDLPAINVVSPASASDQANRQSNINMIRGQALINACRIAVRTIFTSQDDANKLLILISNAIDTFLEYLGDEAGSETLANQGIIFDNDEVYQSINQLKPALKKSMDSIGSGLAKIVNYEVGPEVLSSLTLSYDRYEDLTRGQEIIDRNPLLILNPCFIPNGKTINILSE